MTSDPNLEDVVAYFDGKTQSILRRYGPGPRVHYHTGIVNEPPPVGASTELLRGLLVRGQERMLWRAAAEWDAANTLTGEVLDVGCGLGGGAIFWAQEFGARVTALTCVASHADIVARFAEEAGVRGQIEPRVGDAATTPGECLFDAAVAVDSSGYLPRKQWLNRIVNLLRPGGSLFIVDCFLENPSYADLFDRHWRTRIGAVDEYLGAARQVGLKARAISDVSEDTRHFWTTTLALIEAEAEHRDEGNGAARSSASFEAHSMVREGLANGGLRYALLSFSKDD